MAFPQNSFGTFEPSQFDQLSSDSMTFYQEVTTSILSINSMNSTTTFASNSTEDYLPPLLLGVVAGAAPHLAPENHTISDALPSTDQTAYFGDVFMHFNYNYRQVHGSLSLAVCVFGIIANVLNIIVLTRKNMISPTNLILGAMAVSDLLVIASYIPFVIHNFMRRHVPLEDMYTYGWAVFTLLHAHNTVVFHTISIWLTVLLAIWRYLTVRSPQTNKSQCSMKRAAISILITYLAVPLFCIPIFVCFTIYPFKDDHPNTTIPNVTLYKVDIIQMDGKHEILLEKINFWVFSVLLKLIPCILLTCLSLALIRILIDARKRKERLLGANFGRNNASANAQQKHQTTQQHQPTTNGSPHRSPSSIQPGGNQLYLEIADNSPTECDQSSKSSKGDSSHHADSRMESILYECGRLARCANTFDRCTWCCGFVCCCLGTRMFATACPSSSQKREIKLKLKPSTVVVTTPGTHHHHKHHHHHTHHVSHSSSGNSERTTRMLIAVLIMFLVCEFPSGILALLSGILGKVFFSNVYNNFGELMDMLALINSAVNFVLYCLMSQQFRKTFSQLFCIRWTEEVSNKGGSNGATRKVPRPEATVVTEMVGTPNEENRNLRGSKEQMLMVDGKHKTNGNSATARANKKLCNSTSNSSNSSSCSSSSARSSSSSGSSATNKQEAIEMMPQSAPTANNGQSGPLPSPSCSVPPERTSPTAAAVSNTQDNNNSANKHYQQQDGRQHQHNQHVQANSVVHQHCSNNANQCTTTTTTLVHQSPDRSSSSNLVGSSAHKTVQRLSQARQAIATPTAECELVLNSINNHMSTTSV